MKVDLKTNVGTMVITVKIKPEIEIGMWTAIKLRVLGGRRALAQILNRIQKEMPK